MIYKFSGNNNGGVSFIQKLCNQLIQRDSSSNDYTLLYLLQFSVMNISYLLVKFQLWIPVTKLSSKSSLIEYVITHMTFEYVLKTL